MRGGVLCSIIRVFLLVSFLWSSTIFAAQPLNSANKRPNYLANRRLGVRAACDDEPPIPVDGPPHHP